MKITEQQFAYDEEEVLGLIQICKDLSEYSMKEKEIVMFMNFNPLVVEEARRRVLNKK